MDNFFFEFFASMFSSTKKSEILLQDFWRFNAILLTICFAILFQTFNAVQLDFLNYFQTLWYHEFLVFLCAIRNFSSFLLLLRNSLSFLTRLCPKCTREWNICSNFYSNLVRFWLDLVRFTIQQVQSTLDIADWLKSSAISSFSAIRNYIYFINSILVVWKKSAI